MRYSLPPCLTVLAPGLLSCRNTQGHPPELTRLRARSPVTRAVESRVGSAAPIVVVWRGKQWILESPWILNCGSSPYPFYVLPPANPFLYDFMPASVS